MREGGQILLLSLRSNSPSLLAWPHFHKLCVTNSLRLVESSGPYPGLELFRAHNGAAVGVLDLPEYGEEFWGLDKDGGGTAFGKRSKGVCGRRGGDRY